MVAAASTIGVVSGTITSAADAAKALEPVAGRLAEALFAVGLFGASVLAATIMPLSTAFVICEAFGWESGVDKRFADARSFFTIYTFVLAFGALVVLIPGLDLLPVILASQNLQGLLLPIVLVFMVLLANDRRLMGAHANGRVGNVLAWGAVGIVVVLDAVLLGVAALGVFGVSAADGPARAGSSSAPPLSRRGCARARRGGGPLEAVRAGAVVERVAVRFPVRGAAGDRRDPAEPAGPQQRRRDARAVAAGADQRDLAVVRQPIQDLGQLARADVHGAGQVAGLELVRLADVDDERRRGTARRQRRRQVVDVDRRAVLDRTTGPRPSPRTRRPRSPRSSRSRSGSPGARGRRDRPGRPR